MDLMFVQVAGRLGSDPEVRHTPTGQKITTFRMAVNTKRQGKEKTVWWRVTIFGDRFDKMLPYIKKGSLVMVMGNMNPPEMYQDREGNTQVSVEVIADSIHFISTGVPRERAEGQNQAQNGFEVTTSVPGGSYGSAMTMSAPSMGVPGLQSKSEMNDDIPF